MSDQQVEIQPERFGSKFAQMFGYVTPEDRSKWEQQRAQNKPNVSAVKQAAKLSMNSMMDFGERNLGAKLSAAHRVAEKQRFEETHDKITSRRFDPNTKSIIETIDYEPKDEDQDGIESDLEM